MISEEPSRKHHRLIGVMAMREPLLWDFWDFSWAAFLQRWAWCFFIPQALGTEFFMVPPTSTGFELYQFPIYSAIIFKLSSPSALSSPFPTANANSESSVGCPGSSLCMPPPLIPNACSTLTSQMPGENSRYAPMTSPKTAPHRDPRMWSMISSLWGYMVSQQINLFALSIPHCKSDWSKNVDIINMFLLS